MFISKLYHPQRTDTDTRLIRYRESPTTAVNESFTCTSPLKKKATADAEVSYQDSKFDYESMISYTAPDKNSCVV